MIVLCNARDRDTAVNAVRKGAHDFFCYDDPDLSSLRRAVAGILNSGEGEKADPNGADRRTNARFPCRLAVSYQALEHPFFSGVATSETLNISSKGVLFSTDVALEPGQLLQVSVDWPARLENQVPLKLVAEGRIVRNLNGLAAMRIDKYEFRTRRARAGSGPGNNLEKAGHQAVRQRRQPQAFHPSRVRRRVIRPMERDRAGTSDSLVIIRIRRNGIVKSLSFKRSAGVIARLRTRARQQGFEIAGNCQPAAFAAAIASAGPPDVLLLDITAGLTFADLSDLHACVPECPVVLWADALPLELMFKTLEFGVRGVVQRNVQPEQLVESLRKVAAGELQIGFGARAPAPTQRSRAGGFRSRRGSARLSRCCVRE